MENYFTASRRIRLVALFSAVLASWLLCFSVSVVDALDADYAEAWRFQIQIVLDRNPAYVWGGKNPNVDTYDTKAKQWKKGLDCSGLVYWTARQAAIPGISITCSRDMAQGRGGWIGLDVIGLPQACDLDLLFWSFTSDRPDGHVGIVLSPGVVQASTRRGAVLDPMRGKLVTDLTGIRHLTIGDDDNETVVEE